MCEPGQSGSIETSTIYRDAVEALGEQMVLTLVDQALTMAVRAAHSTTMVAQFEELATAFGSQLDREDYPAGASAPVMGTGLDLGAEATAYLATL